MDKPDDEVIAIITQNTMTGLFTLFIDENGTWNKVATGKTPQFAELDKLLNR